MSVYTALVTLTKIECPACHRVYAISEDWREKSGPGASKYSWRCPYCRDDVDWHRAEQSDVEKERKLRVRAENKLAREQSSHYQTRADRDHKEAQRRGEKAAKTKLRTRVKNGVCPCCNRSFENLQRHIHKQHPKWKNA